MQSQSLLISHSALRLPNLAVDQEPLLSRIETAPSVDRCSVGRTVLGFTGPSLSTAATAAAAWRFTVPRRKNLGATYRSMHGGVSVKSRLENGDGVLIVDHGSRRAESNAMLHEFVKMYKAETGHRVVEAAHMELAVPTIADAFDRCVEQGATRIIISPYFLFPGRHWDKDIPALAAEAAKRHPLVSYLVTAPIGLHKLMVTVIHDRMEYCLSQAAGEVSQCDMCKGSDRCKQLTSQELQPTSDTLASPIQDLTPPRVPVR